MDQSSQKSVTEWIADWKQGDQRAAQKLWERYYQALVVGTVERKLKGIREIWSKEQPG